MDQSSSFSNLSSKNVSNNLITTATTDNVSLRHNTADILTTINGTSFNGTGTTAFTLFANITNATLGSYVTDDVTYFGYIYLALVIVGISGNVLSIAVLTRQKHRNSSTATYLTALAFSDIIILLSSTLGGFLLHVYDIDYLIQGEYWCKFGTWIVYASTTTSSWLLVAVTIERTISVTFPYQVKRLCTPNIAKNVVIIIWCGMYVLYSHFLYGMEVMPFLGCVHRSNDYEIFFYYVLPLIDITMVFGIPCFFILLGNIIIIVTLKRNRRKRHNMTRSKRHTDTSMTITLVVVSITFTLTMSPQTIVYNLLRYLDGTMYTVYTLTFAFSVMFLVSNVNAAANFFLYFLCGSKFRADVKTLFKDLIKKLVGTRLEQIEVLGLHNRQRLFIIDHRT